MIKKQYSRKVTLIQSTLARYTYSAFKPKAFNRSIIEATIPWLYRQHGLEVPEIYYCGNPLSCQRTAANSLSSKAWRHVPLLEDMEFAIWNGNPKISRKDRLKVWNAAKNITDVKFAIEKSLIRQYQGEFISFSAMRSVQMACFYDYFCELSMFKRDPLWEKICRYILQSGVFLALFGVDAAILCPNPSSIGLNDGKLHRAYGPAVEWSDSCKLFFLNGIEIPESFFMLNEKNQNLLRQLMSQKNATIRAAIIKKVGIEKVIEGLGGRVVDQWNGYELIQLDIPEINNKVQYLKMINPSVGTVHLEGVPPPPVVMSVQEALAWRDGDFYYVIPDQLT